MRIIVNVQTGEVTEDHDFTPDRLGDLRKRGDPIAAFLAEQINAWDPNHFKD